MNKTNKKNNIKRATFFIPIIFLCFSCYVPEIVLDSKEYRKYRNSPSYLDMPDNFYTIITKRGAIIRTKDDFLYFRRSSYKLNKQSLTVLENIKNLILEASKEKSENTKELQIKNLEEKNIKELKENLKETELNKNTENIEEINSDYNFDLEDNIQSNKRENKTENLNNNSNNNLNKTISDDKGAEITIINMKDSPEGANLKGFNHYNNVSKTQSSNSLTENMIKFQDLMGKLVEKAQVAINNGKSEVLMSLNPEYLGKVRLKISMEGDNFVGKIFVDNAEIKDIFTKNLDTVITSLNEIGINIEGFDVMLRQDMPNEEFSEFADGNPFGKFGREGGDFTEEVVTDIRNYIVPERKLNLLI